MNIAHNRLNLAGKKFNYLSIVSFHSIKSYKSGQKTLWNAKCVCGKELIIHGSSVTKKIPQISCGCIAHKALSERSKTHGMTDTRSYRIWQAMLNRCRNKNLYQFNNWGGRGIKVCERWLSFDNFFRDMGCPPNGYSIDRINNDGNYEPDNCKWSSKKEQARNTSKNRIIEFNGEAKLLVDWADQLGIDQASLRERLDKWSLEKALTTPKKGK